MQLFVWRHVTTHCDRHGRPAVNPALPQTRSAGAACPLAVFTWLQLTLGKTSSSLDFAVWPWLDAG